jgi:hypothetical protein
VTVKPAHEAAHGGEAAGEGIVGLTAGGALDGAERPLAEARRDGRDLSVGVAELVEVAHAQAGLLRWHFLNFFPLPQGHRSLRPTFITRRCFVVGSISIT